MYYRLKLRAQFVGKIIVCFTGPIKNSFKLRDSYKFQIKYRTLTLFTPLLIN